MKILLISTSSKAASAALSLDGIVVRSAISDGAATHSETIMPLIDSLFENEEGIAISDIDAVCADVGPGSFTGVRIGVCIANAMAYALGKPAVAVSSLEALALAIRSELPVCALIDARNSNGYAAVYQNGSALMEPAPVAVNELISALPQNTLFTGDGAAIYRQEILQALPNASFASEKSYLLRAEMLAQIAHKRLISGDTHTSIMPLYLRPTQAERVYKERKRNI